MSTPYVHEQVKCDQACKHYKTCKHILIIQGKSLKNDSNEHITEKCSSEHVEKKQSLKIICMSNHTTNAKCMKYMHLGTILLRAQVWSTQDIFAISKSTKKMLQKHRDKDKHAEYKLKQLRAHCTEVLYKKTAKIAVIEAKSKPK